MAEKQLAFLKFTKADEAQHLVWGIASREEVDRSGEIYDYEASKPFVKEWSDRLAKATDGENLGNVRRMHPKFGLQSVGKLVKLEFNDAEKQVEVCAKITDDATWSDITGRVLTGYSFGGTYAKSWKDEATGKRRYAARPSELSVVDAPCVESAVFTMFKADGSAVRIESKPTTKRGAVMLDSIEALTKLAGSTRVGAHASAILVKIAKRKDVSPKEGEGKYGADAEFADEKNKKYPLNTKAHVANALSRWGDAKNRAKYSSEDQKKIGAKIQAAKKKFKIGDEEAEKMSKGMYGVAQLAQAIASLESARDSAEMETMHEKDGSKVPDMLDEAIEQAGEALVAMAEEEIDEMTEDGDEDGEEDEGAEKFAKVLSVAETQLKKYGAKYSKETKDKIQAIHDHTTDMGAECHNPDDEEEEEKAMKAEELKKLAAATGKTVEELEAALSKAAPSADVAALEKKNKELEDRLAKLEAGPALAAAKLPVVALGKTDDLAKKLAVDASARLQGVELKKTDDPASALELMKSVMEQGGAGMTPGSGEPLVKTFAPR